MAEAASKLEVLLDIRSRLDELTKATGELSKFRQEATSTGQALKTGFGIEIARRGLDLLTSSVRSMAFEAFRMAGDIKDSAQNLGISTDAYQVLGNVIKDAGGDVGLLTMAVSNSNRSLAEARNVGSAAASAYRALGLDIVALERLPIERRFESIARAVAGSTDKTAAFDAASKILGSRNLPTLLGALRDLATDGYGNLEEVMKRAGRVMEKETIERLDRAQKQIEKLKQSVAIDIGEGIGGMSAVIDSARKDFGGTLWDFLKAGPMGMGSSALALRIARDNPATPAAPTNNDADAAARELAMKERLAVAEFELSKAMLHRQTIESNPNESEFSKRERVAELLQKEVNLRWRLVEAIKAMPLELTGETPQQRALRIAKLEAEMTAGTNTGLGLVRNPLEQRASGSRDRFSQFLSDRSESSAPGIGQSAAGGAMDWVTSLGTEGEQVAGALQSSLGAAVQGISDGIYGWITGTQSFGETMAQLGDTIFRTMLDTIVQMGVQWLVTQALIKTGMITTEALGDTLRIGRVAKENAAEAATLPAKTAGAAASGISSFGAALLFGVLAVALISALAGGFAEGGYTAPGPKTRPAGVVHAGEWVAPQWLVKDPEAGPVIAALEAMREGAPGYKFGGWVFDFKKHFRWNPRDWLDPKKAFLTDGQKEVNGWLAGKPRAQSLAWGGVGLAGDMQLDALNVPSVGSAAPVSSSVPSMGDTETGRSFASRESARNVHVYLDRGAWLDAVQNDLRGVAREVYAEEARKG